MILVIGIALLVRGFTYNEPEPPATASDIMIAVGIILIALAFTER